MSMISIILLTLALALVSMVMLGIVLRRHIRISIGRTGIVIAIYPHQKGTVTKFSNDVARAEKNLPRS
mgnify:FL=1